MKEPPARPAGKSKKAAPPKRFNRTVNVAAPLRRVTGPLIRSKGFGGPEIVHRWPEIVGEQLAALSCPMKIVRDRSQAGHGASLHVRVAGSAALEMEHLAPQILERINTFYGYRAIHRLRLEQGPLPLRTTLKPPAPRRLSPREKESLGASVAGIRNPDLREALLGLGTAIKASKKP